MSTVAKPQVLRLYRVLLKTGRQFVDYNYRQYTLRCVKEDFRQNAACEDPAKVRELYDYGLAQLAMLKRQTAINRMYAEHQVIVDDVEYAKESLMDDA
mmetsp:Transcript_72903/g.122183  ORF Transcript_72903/g.122183 Transcript_72903/m.122183 type:complete len:98 (+) Transcript_72903:18-311(+)